jgi:hypothetical protein
MANRLRKTRAEKGRGRACRSGTWQNGTREVIVPGVNPLNPPNVNEVLRREEALRQETMRRESGYDDEPWSRPKRKRKLIRKLAKFITGTSEKTD